ncbi:MAG: septum site-determining protein MinC [Rhodanobacter sp.]
MKAKPEASDACELRFGQVGMACVQVRRADAAALQDELQRRVKAAPQMFGRAAVVLDFGYLIQLPDDPTVEALLNGVRQAGMLPVGIAYGTSETAGLAERIGLPLIAKFRAAYEPVRDETSAAAAPEAPRRRKAAPATEAPEIAPAPAEPAATQLAMFHTGSIRSGQQLYARERDLIVTGTVANGAEVIADGNIHIYGSLRGRAMAGAQGDQSARIFVADFRAELVAIAGQYRVFEQIPTDFEGHSVQCWLDGEKLLLAKL